MMVVEYNDEYCKIILRKDINAEPYEVIDIVDLLEVWEKHKADTPQTDFPKRIDKPIRAVWLDDNLNEIGAPQTEKPRWTKENCKGCKYNEYPYDYSTCFVRVCIDGNKYEPKQTDCPWK